MGVPVVTGEPCSSVTGLPSGLVLSNLRVVIGDPSLFVSGEPTVSVGPDGYVSGEPSSHVTGMNSSALVTTLGVDFAPLVDVVVLPLPPLGVVLSVAIDPCLFVTGDPSGCVLVPSGVVIGEPCLSVIGDPTESVGPLG